MPALPAAKNFARIPSRCWSYIRLVKRLLVMFVAGYICFLLTGFLPANVNYRAPAADYVTMYVRSNDIHTDIVLPVNSTSSGFDWQKLFPPSNNADPRSSSAGYVAIGWGDREFFVETQHWSDLTAATVANAALWPSETVLHVDYLHTAKPGPWMHEVRISHQQHRRLIRYIHSFVVQRNTAGAAVLASDRSYGRTDRFYRSSGSYHMCNTCNQWTGAGLRTAGVRCGIWTPTRTHVQFWLPESAGSHQPAAPAM